MGDVPLATGGADHVMCAVAADNVILAFSYLAGKGLNTKGTTYTKGIMGHIERAFFLSDLTCTGTQVRTCPGRKCRGVSCLLWLKMGELGDPC